MINHSEHRFRLSDIDSCVSRAKEAGLITCICSNTLNTSKAASFLNPDFVAVELLKLIGGNISVSKVQPGLVKGTVDAVAPNVKVLCGASVKN